MRSMVAASNRSVLYSQRRVQACRPSRAASASDRTWRCRLASGRRLTCTPSSASAAPGAFCSANITWNSGLRLRSRAGCKLLDQLLERQVLMRVGAQRAVAHPCEQLAKRRIARQVRAQHQRVDEEADQPFQSRCAGARRSACPPRCRPGRCSGAAAPGRRPAAS